MGRELTFPRRMGAGCEALRQHMPPIYVRKQLAYKKGQALKFWQVTCKIQQGWNKSDE